MVTGVLTPVPPTVYVYMFIVVYNLMYIDNSFFLDSVPSCSNCNIWEQHRTPCVTCFIQRNPNIKLYGLPWDFPGWIGNGTQNPYQDVVRLATYITKWIQGAKVYHNLDIDYIGVRLDNSQRLHLFP